MNYLKQYCTVICLFFSIFGHVTAQPVANFTSSSFSGCSPLTNVQLTDLSTGAPTIWEWRRNGTPFSTLQHPTVTLTNPGTYIITLVASNSLGSSSHNANIVVHPNPTANFIAASPTAGCLPHTVNFTDMSTVSGTTISKYTWAFGDGGGSALKNPSHTYTLTGTFPVSLKVEDARGCEGTKQIPNYILVRPLPNASFSSNSVRQTCKPPLTVVFDNSSSGTGTLSYLWNFGDGQTSTATNPSHTYTSFGLYNVKLTVTDQNGCVKTFSYDNYVRIEPVQADFNLSNDTVCFGDSIIFYNNSQGALGFNWNFGDNTSATGSAVVTHTYTDSGYFQVRLIASISAAGCLDTAYKNIYVQRVVSNFTVSPEYICEEPTDVVYQNHSVNASSFRWHFGRNCPHDIAPTCGIPYTGINRTISYKQPVMNRPFEGIYTDTLVAISDFGCRDTFIRDTSVAISLVSANFLMDNFSGCRPFSIDFSNHSKAYNPSYQLISPLPTLTNFAWSLKGSPYSSGFDPPDYSVVDTGKWEVSLVVMNSLGCRDTLELNFEAGDQQVADFYVLRDSVCSSDYDTAVSLATDTNFIDQYIWRANPGAHTFQGGHIAAFNPQDTGYYSITHIVGQHGCYDTITKPKQFYSKGPFVDILSASIFTCADSSRISFMSSMIGAAKWYWSFGHASMSVDSVNVNPIVNYPMSGTYFANLIAYSADGACSDDDNIPVYAGSTHAVIICNDSLFTPQNPPGQYVSDTLHGCAPFTTYFNAYASPGVMKVDWIFDGNLIAGIAYDSTISYFFDQKGHYIVKLIGYDTLAGCIDSTSIVVAVHKPVVDFIGNPNNGCTPLSVLLEPNVLTDNVIKKYYWTVGSIVDSTTNFSRTFTSTVDLNARLIAVDTFGCSDTLVKEHFVTASSFAIFFYASSNRQICSGDSISFFQALPVSNVAYTWDFGDGGSSTAVMPFHTYNDSGTFDVTLTGRDSAGCEIQQVRSAYIEVQASPNANFTAVPTDSTCYPLPVQFTADTNMVYYNENTYLYKLGDFQAASNYKNPFYNYVKPGTYTVSLIATTPFGCSDTIVKTDYIKIGGPYGEMDISPDSICKGDSVIFKLINGINIDEYGWDFGDGQGLLNVSPVSHVYRDSFGLLYPNIYMTDSIGGCAKTFEDTIYIYETIAGFTFSDSLGCATFDPALQNTSSQSTRFQWDFGDGNTSGTKNATKIYPNPGVYLLKLIVSNDIGCRDTLSQLFRVFSRPDAHAERDTLICEGDTIQLKSSGGTVYTWRPIDYLSNAAVPDPLAFPVSSTIYAVEVADTNNCKDTAYVDLQVQNPVHLNLKDRSMIIGQDEILLDAFGGPGLKYKWIPSTGLSCDTCPRPKLTALVSGYYEVIVSDTNGCFQTSSRFYLEVLEKFTLDVPKAFTPNGDGINDIIYADGWGLKELKTFTIYNRWGELPFESHDLNTGWDGTYKGKLQDIESYVYYVEGLTYNNEVLVKKGSFSLLR